MEHRLTAEDREYLAGWAFSARVMNLEPRHAAMSPAEYGAATVRLALMPWATFSDPFTPRGAGMADAALSAWGLDA